jgi:amino acid transporter
VVGNVGFFGALIIIILAHVATVSTGLAMSSMSTNVKIGTGGFYSILSRSLGLEIGGAIGIPLYLSQALSIALYIVGFVEVINTYFPDINARLLASIMVIVLFGFSLFGAKIVIRIQYFVLVLIAFSLVAFFIGEPPPLKTASSIWYAESNTSFWIVFAIFFPAVTGISAGASMSGDLKNPRKNIPNGMLSAIGLGMVIYIGTAYWLSRVASPEDLITNTYIMAHIAKWE